MADVELSKRCAGQGLGIGLHHAVDVDVGITIGEGIAGRIGKDDVVVAAGQLKLGPHVALVHLVDPVEQGGDGRGGQHLGATVELGVLPRRRDGDDVTLAHVAIHLHLVRQRPAGLAADNLVGVLLQPAVGILLVIDGITVGIAQRVDEHRLALMGEHGVKAQRPQVKTSRLYWCCRIMALEGQDLGEFGRLIGRQQIIGLQGEGHLSPLWQRQGQRTGPGLQAGKIIDGHLGDPKLVGPYFIAVGGAGARRHRVPLLGREATRAHQAGYHQRQGRKFHQLHLFSPFKCTHPNCNWHHSPAALLSPAPLGGYSPNGECCTNPV